jgi:hypothetical protein
MNTTAVRNVMNDVRLCALAMLESGTYIERELPNVRLTDAARATASELCSRLIGAKHDIIHELSELDDLLNDGVTDERIASALDRIIRWLEDEILRIHELVTTLEAAAQNDPARQSAYLLVVESALNILAPFNRAKAGADSIKEPDATGNAP